MSVYFAELHASHGWSASLIASATTVYYLAGGLLLATVHRAMALLGPRLLLAGGAIVLGAGAIGLSRVQAPWQLLCLWRWSWPWAGRPPPRRRSQPRWPTGSISGAAWR